MSDPIDPPGAMRPGSRGRSHPWSQSLGRAAPSRQPPPGAPAPDAPAPDSAPQGWLGRHLSGLPSSRPGAARADAVPRMENVRITAPDLARRAALRKTRRRLGLAACGFALLFLTVAGKLTVATVIAPRLPRPEAVMVLPSLRAARFPDRVPGRSPRARSRGPVRNPVHWYPWGSPGARSSRHHRRSQRPAAGHLAAIGRAVRRSPADHRPGGRHQPPEAGPAAHRRRGGAAAPVRHQPAIRLHRAPDHPA